MKSIYQLIFIITIIFIFIISTSLAAISDNLDLSNDESCGKLTTNSTILPSDTKIITNEWNFIFFGGVNSIEVFAKSDISNKETFNSAEPKA